MNSRLFLFLRIIYITCIAVSVLSSRSVFADEYSQTAINTHPTITTVEDSRYHTPLAGEPYHTRLWGNDIDVAARDRDNITALALGAAFFAPHIGGEDVQPLASLYVRRRWDDLRFRGIFSIFVNDLDVSKTYGTFQLLGHFDNITIPFDTTEIVEGREIDASSIQWGRVNARVGAGLRYRVAPFQTDNDLRLQLFYQAGYLYSQRTPDTGADVVLPPNTMVQGVLFRTRYDGLQRNILELPHQGTAFGLDAEFMHRNKWSDANYGGAVYKKEDTQDYLKVYGYLQSAFRVPGLTERDRGIIGCYGGFAGHGHLDRFSAFRIGGGPFPTETDDLYRQVYPGAIFNQFPATDYMVATVEYRRELLFFVYLHLRGTYAWVNQDIFTDTGKRFLVDNGAAFTAAITTGMPWRSQMYLEYTYDSSILRSGASGHGISMLWSKEF